MTQLNTMNRGKLVVLTSLVLIVFATLAHSQSTHKQLRKGDLYYDQGEFLEAEEAYRKANDAKVSPQVQYNLGNSIYQQERYDEAVRQFESAAETATDPRLKAQAYYNLGNTHFKSQALDKSVEAYKNALRLSPDDTDTKKNLTLALQKLQQQQQQQQQDQQEGGDEDQQQQQQQQPSPQNEDRQQQEQSSQGDKESQSTKPETSMTKEEAEELLRIIDNEDSKVQEKLRKATGNPHKPKKDW